MEAEQLADRVMVVRRRMGVPYDNELVDTGRRHLPAAGQTMRPEMRRWWSAQEKARFRRGLASTDRRVRSGAVGEDQRLAV
ncbi:hypothetical protein [Streptomyces sp. 8K308]|uniref:hypothetical protein n=1 Tax=Streptomyces sp. 8K308 TaxID=2530388 RepID=UPI001FB82F4E|nr:hypothetical protein [Streptomyces sp. 8K308]